MIQNSNVHYEILARKGSKWLILDIRNVRKDAETLAQKSWDSQRYGGVKVVKESFDHKEKTFSSVEIFMRGTDPKVSKYAESNRVTPCMTPNSLYSPAGRNSIWRLLGTTLKKWNMTPTELLHSWDHYNKLYNTGTLLQNAIQRTAVAFENSQDSIQERMRKLYKVVDAAVDIVRSERSSVPNLEIGRLKPITEAIKDRKNKSFLLIASLTNYIAPAVTLDDKLGRLSVFLNKNRPDWVLSTLDQLISELLLHRALLKSLLANCESRGAILITLAYWSAGQLTRAETMLKIKFNADAHIISDFIHEGLLPDTSAVISNQLKKELSSGDKLVEGGSLLEQFQVLHQLNLTLGWLSENEKRFIGMDEEIAARQGRLLNSQSIAIYMKPFGNPLDKANALLNLAQVSAGKTVSRAIANYMLPMLSTPENEAFLVSSKRNIMSGMQVISALQKRVLESSFNEMHKRKISEKLDDYCKMIMKKSSMLTKLDKTGSNIVVKTHRLLDMLLENIFTEGFARSSACHMVKHYVSDPAFSKIFEEGLDQRAKIEAWADLNAKISSAGVNDVVDLEILSTQAVERASEENIEEIISKSDLYGKKATEDLW